MNHNRLNGLIWIAIYWSAFGCSTSSPTEVYHPEAGVASFPDGRVNAGVDGGTDGRTSASIEPNCDSDSGDVSTDGSDGIVIVIDMFSGLPNPCFIIGRDNTADIEFITNAVSNAEIVDDDYPIESYLSPNYLGYRGVMVENEAKIKYIPDRIEIYDDKMLFKSVDETAVIKSILARDKANHLQDYLLQCALTNRVISEDLFEDIYWQIYLRKEGKPYEPRDS
jgi:hypothetical protein